MVEDISPEAAFSPAEYNRVIAETSLLAISMMKSSFEVKPEIYDRSKPQNLSYDTDVESVQYSAEQGALSGFFKFSVQGKRGRKNILKATAEYFVVYEAPDNLPSAAAEAFCSHVGLFAAYPYFRAWVSQSAWSANVMLPPLPTLSAMGKPVPNVKLPNSN